LVVEHQILTIRSGEQATRWDNRRRGSRFFIEAARRVRTHLPTHGFPA
jgi:hypothetical protein